MSAPPDSDGGLDYAEVARAHMADLFRYARSLCRDVHQAEDLVQDTLLRGWRGHASLRDIGAIKAWLLTTLRREFYRSLDHARINKAHLSLDDTDAPISDEELASWPAAIEDQLDVERSLERLPATYKEVLVLQAYFGYATDEMAHILGVSETAVSNRLLRARKALSEQRHSPHTASPQGSVRDRPKGLAVVLPLRRTTP